MIRDQVIYEKKVNFLQTKCFSCKSKNHISLHCPLIHFVPNRIKVVKRYMKDTGQKSRSSFKRFRNRKFNSLYSLEHIQKTSQNLKDLISDISFDSEDQESVKESAEFCSDSNFENNNYSPSNEEMTYKEFQRKYTKRDSEKFSQYFLKDVPKQQHHSNYNELDKKMKSLITGKSDVPSPKIEASENEETKEEKQLFERKNRFSKKKDSFKIEIEKNSAKIYNTQNSMTARLNLRRENKIIFSPRSSLARNFNAITTTPLEHQTDFNDAFLKEFEKGTNFKNFYPDSNLITIIVENRQRSKKKKKTSLSKSERTFLNKKMKTNIKFNRIVPEELENDKKIKIENSPKKINKSYSNIFLKKNETRFLQETNKMSFFDVVNEVLHNKELRKKLAFIKKKSLTIRKNN